MDPPQPPRPDLPAGRPPGPGDPPPATWRAIEALPVVLIALGATLVAGLVLEVFYPATISATGKATPPPAYFAFINVIAELALAVSVVVWVRWINRGSLAALGMPRRPVGDILAGAVTGAALILVAGVTLEVIRSITQAILGHHLSTPKQIPGDVRGWPLAVTGVAVVALAPLGEELFFRGFLYKGLRRRYPVWAATVISSILFGLSHVQPLLIPALAVVGAGLALVYERRKSLLASMTAHATFNLVGFLTIALSRR